MRNARPTNEIVDQSNPDGNEIPDSESVDKFTLQAGFVALAYALSFGFMCLLGVISLILTSKNAAIITTGTVT